MSFTDVNTPNYLQSSIVAWLDPPPQIDVPVAPSPHTPGSRDGLSAGDGA